MDVLWQNDPCSSFTEQLKHENERWRMYKCVDKSDGEAVKWKAGSKDRALTDLQTSCVLQCNKTMNRNGLFLPSAKLHFHQHICHFNDESNRFRYRRGIWDNRKVKQQRCCVKDAAVMNLDPNGLWAPSCINMNALARAAEVTEVRAQSRTLVSSHQCYRCVFEHWRFLTAAQRPLLASGGSALTPTANKHFFHQGGV